MPSNLCAMTRTRVRNDFQYDMVLVDDAFEGVKSNAFSVSSVVSVDSGLCTRNKKNARASYPSNNCFTAISLSFGLSSQLGIPLGSTSFNNARLLKYASCPAPND
eukprot:271142_1